LDFLNGRLMAITNAPIAKSSCRRTGVISAQTAQPGDTQPYLRLFMEMPAIPGQSSPNRSPVPVKQTNRALALSPFLFTRGFRSLLC
jgi:hypothetical protein